MIGSRGKQDWKSFLSGILTDIKGSVDSALASITKATFANLIKSITGEFPSEWFKRLGDSTANRVVGKPEVDQQKIAQAQQDMLAIQSSSKEIMADLATTLRLLNQELEHLKSSYTRDRQQNEASAALIAEEREATREWRDVAAYLREVLNGVVTGLAETQGQGESINTPSIPRESLDSLFENVSRYGGREVLPPSEIVKLGQSISPNTSVTFSAMMDNAGIYTPATDEIMVRSDNERVLAHEYAHAMQQVTGIGRRHGDLARGLYGQYGAVPDNIGEGAADVLSGTTGYIEKLTTAQVSQANAIAEMLVAAAREQQQINRALASYSLEETESALEGFDENLAGKLGSLDDFLVDLYTPTTKGMNTPGGVPPSVAGAGGGGLLAGIAPIALGAISGGISGGWKGALMGGLLGLGPLLTKSIVSGMKSGATEGAQEASPSIERLVNQTGGMFSSAIGSIGSMFTGMFGGVVSFAQGMFGSLFSWVQSLFSGLSMPGGGGGGGGIGGMLGGLMGGGGMGGGMGGGLGGMLGMFMGGGGGASFGFGSAPAGVMGPTMANGGFFSSGLGWLSSLFSSFMFLEKGGYTSGFEDLSGIVNRPQSRILSFANGGVAPAMGMAGIPSSSTLVNIAENAPSNLEAVVPLPDNRSIPVSFKNANFGGGNSTQNIMLDVHFSTQVIDPAALRTPPDEIIKTVTANYDGDGELRTRIREDIGRS
jgi:hypothetical protein